MNNITIKDRFDGYLPIAVDLETTGVQCHVNGLLEIGAFVINCKPSGELIIEEKLYSAHIKPFPGAIIDPKALEITQIDPDHPLRLAIDEQTALKEFDQQVQQELKKNHCRRAILVGHNAHFDLNFLNAARKRCDRLEQNPFHAFTCFDTATLAGMALGKTILAKALKVANIAYNKNEAHSAIYDAQLCAKLFCHIANNLVKYNTNIAVI